MGTMKLHPLIESISGHTGNLVPYTRYGKQYFREYVKPRDHNTAGQRINRQRFAEAVREWQAMTHEERHKFDQKARGKQMSGYNLFISGQMKQEKASYITREPFKTPSFPLRYSSVPSPFQVHSCFAPGRETNRTG